MMYTLLVIFHLLGAIVWVGGHIALVAAILPSALRERDPRRILEFERGFGPLGMVAMAVQLLTGLWLASIAIGDWRVALDNLSTATMLVLAKVGLLVATIALAAHAHHRLMPRLSAQSLRAFAVHAWTVTALALCMAIIGAFIRVGV